MPSPLRMSHRMVIIFDRLCQSQLIHEANHLFAYSAISAHVLYWLGIYTCTPYQFPNPRRHKYSKSFLMANMEPRMLLSIENGCRRPCAVIVKSHFISFAKKIRAHLLSLGNILGSRPQDHILSLGVIMFLFFSPYDFLWNSSDSTPS